jgi:hypothetical protein
MLSRRTAFLVLAATVTVAGCATPERTGSGLTLRSNLQQSHLIDENRESGLYNPILNRAERLQARQDTKEARETREELRQQRLDAQEDRKPPDSRDDRPIRPDSDDIDE